MTDDGSLDEEQNDDELLTINFRNLWKMSFGIKSALIILAFVGGTLGIAKLCGNINRCPFIEIPLLLIAFPALFLLGGPDGGAGQGDFLMIVLFESLVLWLLVNWLHRPAKRS